MRLGFYIDPKIPPGELNRRAYSLKLIAKSMGVPAFIFNASAGRDSAHSMDFTVYHGQEPKVHPVEYDLTIPYEEMPEGNAIKWFGEIPVLHDREEPHYLVENKRFGFDVCVRIFQLLTGYDEFSSRETDGIGRHLPPVAARQWNLERHAVANRYIHVIRGILEEKLGRLESFPHWKGGRPFAVALTHDVDAVSRHSLGNAQNRFMDAIHAAALSNRLKFFLYAFWSLALSPAKYVRGHDDLWAFEKMSRLEAKWDVRSTFYCLPPRNGGMHHLDRPYSYNEKMLYEKSWHSLRNVLRDLREKGWEIGLHAGLESFCSGRRLAEQKRNLEEEVGCSLSSVRQHFLRFRNDVTWRAQEWAGFTSDSSYGFNEKVGFRANFCLPFQPYSMKEEREIDLWEVPLVIQDNAVFARGRCGKGPLDDVMETLREVRKHGGLCTLLWHSNTVWSKGYPGWLEAYEKILRWSLEEGAFVGSVEELISWWRNRDRQIPVICEWGVGKGEKFFTPGREWPTFGAGTGVVGRGSRG